MLLQRTKDDFARLVVALDQRSLPCEGADRVAVVVQVGEFHQARETITAAAFDISEVFFTVTPAHRIDTRDNFIGEAHVRQEIERDPGVFNNVVKDRDDLSRETMLGNMLHHTNRMKDVGPAGLIDLFRVRRRRNGDGSGEIRLVHVG